jgi:hypothetical protein
MPVQKKVNKPVDAGAELESVGVAAALITIANALGVGTNAGAGAGAAAGAGLGATDTQNKTDVNVPEVLTGMNALTQKRALAQESAIDSFTNQMLQNAITHHDTITTHEIKNSDLIAKQAIRHSDVAIDRIWNFDFKENAAASALLGRLIASLNNPIPPEE